jgi:hypothetical protein
VKPRPLSRSFAFWSGILVMFFIGFAWRDSMAHASSVSASKLAIVSGGALVQVWSIQETGWSRPVVQRNANHPRWPARPFATPMLVRGDGFRQQEMNRSDRGAVTYQDRMTGVAKWGFPPRNWVLFLPHWIVLLAFALAWTGLLFWRARRVH